MQKAPIKIPGLTVSWRQGAWLLRFRRQAGSLKIERERTVRAPSTSPPANEAVAFVGACEAEWAAMLRGEEERTPATVGAFAPLWLASLRKKGKTMAFAETRGSYLEDFVLPYFGDMRPRDVKAKHVEDFKGWLVDQRQRNGEPYAHGTRLTVWSTTRLFLRWIAVQAGTESPVRDVVFDVRRNKPPKEKDVVDADELGRLITSARELSDDGRMGPDMLAMIVCGFGFGMRFSELSALWWSDVDLTAGKLRIERSQYKGHIGPPKTEASRRVVFVPAELVDMLRAHRQWQVREQAPGVETGIVFPSRRGGYRLPQAMIPALKKACAHAGIAKHLTSHCLRHTANNLLRQVASGIVTRAMLGHVTEQMTQRYSHVGEGERRQAHRQAFGDVLKLGSTPQ